ncbi:MAG: Kae1-like domain-containing protein [Bacillota bacterium]
MSDKCVLGIDTSNYKTSLAVVKGGETVADIRRFLSVKEGERGLRQSEALFQHVQNLPEMFSELRDVFDGTVDAVAYSTRPRAVEGSYMPCFTAGAGQAVSTASALNVPAVGFSHQEGHVEAVLSAFAQKPEGVFAACHFSGGTCELLKITVKAHEPCGGPSFENITGESAFYDIEITGGTKDISYGQVLDRAGVALGLPFPCGEVLDGLAMKARKVSDHLTAIKVSDACVNLSGFDTQIRNTLKDMEHGVYYLIREVFEKISESMIAMIEQNAEKTGTDSIYMSGGVASSRFIREYIAGRLADKGISVYFADASLSSDNAIGTALLGSRYLWD